MTPKRAPVTHELKCWPLYFGATWTGRKPFEVRRTTDRTFMVGDTLLLREYDPTRPGTNDGYTGREIEGTVSYILHGSLCKVDVGIDAETAVLGLPEPLIRRDLRRAK